MEWVGLILGPGLAIAAVLGILAWTITRVGILNTIGAVAVCVAVAFLSAVIALGIQQL